MSSEVGRGEAGVNFAADPCLSSHRCSANDSPSPTQCHIYDRLPVFPGCTLSRDNAGFPSFELAPQQLNLFSIYDRQLSPWFYWYFN